MRNVDGAAHGRIDDDVQAADLGEDAQHRAEVCAFELQADRLAGEDAVLVLEALVDRPAARPDPAWSRAGSASCQRADRAGRHQRHAPGRHYWPSPAGASACEAAYSHHRRPDRGAIGDHDQPARDDLPGQPHRAGDRLAGSRSASCLDPAREPRGGRPPSTRRARRSGPSTDRPTRRRGGTGVAPDCAGGPSASGGGANKRVAPGARAGSRASLRGPDAEDAVACSAKAGAATVPLATSAATHVRSRRLIGAPHLGRVPAVAVRRTRGAVPGGALSAAMASRGTNVVSRQAPVSVLSSSGRSCARTRRALTPSRRGSSATRWRNATRAGVRAIELQTRQTTR